MNANELADELQVRYKYEECSECMLEAATMLRQQQADLKDADKYALELERLYEDAKAEIEALKAHPVKEFFEDEPQAEELHGILQSYNEPLNYEVTHPRWSKEKRMFASWEYPQKTYADGIEECAQRAEAYSYMSPNFTALAEELRAILRKAQEK